jgi:iron-sulfur cluster repair protein YtfE (RIC family)
MDSGTKATPALADFAALDECHRQIADHLDRLDALVEHLERIGVDSHARSEARQIEAYLSAGAARHHLDEETLVFPGLLASSDEVLVSTVVLLQQDHGWIEEDWLEIAPQLRAIASGYSWYDPAELRHAVQVFGELCREHIELEESIIYPEARALARQLARRRADRGAVRFTAATRSSS